MVVWRDVALVSNGLIFYYNFYIENNFYLLNINASFPFKIHK